GAVVPPPAGAPISQPVPRYEEPRRNSSAWFFIAIVVLLGVLAGLLFAFGRQLGIFEDDANEITVPDVVGELQTVAEQRLKNQDLEIDAALEPSDRPVGEVVRQDPEGNSTVEEGATVRIWVSAGPETADIPNLF